MNRERNEEGFEFYINAMAKSIGDKAEKIIPLVEEALKKQKGDILDLGAGAGDLAGTLYPLAQTRKVKIVALDEDSRMTDILKKKFTGRKRIKIVQANALDLKLKRKFAVIICSSFLHEVFSENKNLDEIKLVLKNASNHLRPKGTLIIRDGIRPAQKDRRILLEALNPKKLEGFQKILEYTRTEWFKIHDYHNIKRAREFIALSEESAYELAVKYQYPEINWPVEMKEKFGFWSKEEAITILEEAGLSVIHLESYLLPYFAEIFAKDFKFFRWQDGPGAIEIPYFDTHLVIAAQK